MEINAKFTLSVTCSFVVPQSLLFAGQRGGSRLTVQHFSLPTGSFIYDSSHIILFN